jgi:hypothetical protein
MSDERISNYSSMRMCGDNRAAVPATFLIPSAFNAMAMLTLSYLKEINLYTKI